MHIKTGRRVLVAEVREDSVYPVERILKPLGNKNEGCRRVGRNYKKYWRFYK